MGLFAPTWQSRNFSRARKAVERIKDEKKLAEIVKTHWWYNCNEIRKIALERIANQHLLLDILGDKLLDDLFINLVFARITDETILKQIVRSSNKPLGLRRAALNKITDQTFVNSILNTENDYSAKQREYDKEQEVLRKEHLKQGGLARFRTEEEKERDSKQYAQWKRDTDREYFVGGEE